MIAERDDGPIATVLLVDDEENILSSLRRVLRNEGYLLLAASNGVAALELLEQHEVDLIVSDARMPGMDGATLLAKVQQCWPKCARILLTGYADITTTVKAINEGQIYRYISKPWDDDELRLIIRQALAFQFSERERQRLEQLTQEQNARLQDMNETLERRVRTRTAELEETAGMLDVAYAELRRSYVTATEVFANLVNQRFSKDRQTNAQVVALIKGYAEHYQLDERTGNNLAMAAALYNIGKLTWDDHLLGRPSDLLFKEERTRYRKYPELGENLLMALEPVQDAGRLIRHHQERWDGHGFPDRLEGEAIPFGSRLLKLCVDFIELQRGMFLERRLSRDEALLLMKKYEGRLYEPQLCERFIELCKTLAPDLAIADASILVLDTRRLSAGMILARNLHATNGMLLLNEGKQLTLPLISKLIAFEASEGGSYTVFVRKPENDTTPKNGAP